MSTGELRGRIRAADRSLQRALQRRFERRLGLETFERVDLSELGVDRDERVYYAASPVASVPRVLRRLGDRGYGVFADLGSGKGQALVIAAQLPYRRVIGVELSADLNVIARRNLASAATTLRCPDVEIVTGDALTWPIPADLSVVYLYCPFIGSLFKGMLDRIFASYDEHPRPLHVVYSYPWEHNWLVRTGRVATVDVGSSRWPMRPGWWRNDHVIVSYQVVARDGSGDVRQLPPRGLGWRRAMDYWSSPNETRFQLHYPGGPSLFSDPER